MPRSQAEQFAAQLRIADPTDSIAINFMAEANKCRGELRRAEELFVESIQVEIANEQRAYALCMSFEGLLEVRHGLKDYAAAYRSIFNTIDLGLPIRSALCNSALECVLEASGHAAVDAAGRNLLHALATEEFSDAVDKEKTAAFLFSKMAELQIEKLSNGTYRNLDASMAGTTRLRRNCGIPWSYVNIIHGASNPPGEDLHLLTRVLIPWRVSHGMLTGEPIEEMPTAEIPELQSKGMLRLDECAKTPPTAPWASAAD